MKYLVIIEQGESSYGVYVPDLPGCVSVGDTIEEPEHMIREAITLHIQGMRADGLEIPMPMSIGQEMEVGGLQP
jgi:predicted RNase H-like HicB family nuclease